MKQILGVFDPPAGHWVGDGFPVRSLFSYQARAQAISPFLLLDYAGPQDFTPIQQQRGVDTHPHRGIETVSIVYHGEVAHRDSSGGGGTIGPGDVQWMTAGGGILHQEFHSPAFSRSGGPLQMVQLWVNLPAQSKMMPARYQTLVAADIPVVTLPDQAGSLRVIGGEYGGVQGPALTCSPLLVCDARLREGARYTLALTPGWNAMVVVLSGAVCLPDGAVLSDAQYALCAREGDALTLQAQADSLVLVLSGEPIDEPIAGYGPFVMNTREEIVQAMQDYEAGRFGAMPTHSA
jgi:quercetin 2,3-dioxygenase